MKFTSSRVSLRDGFTLRDECGTIGFRNLARRCQAIEAERDVVSHRKLERIESRSRTLQLRFRSQHTAAVLIEDGNTEAESWPAETRAIGFGFSFVTDLEVPEPSPPPRQAQAALQCHDLATRPKDIETRIARPHL